MTEVGKAMGECFSNLKPEELAEVIPVSPRSLYRYRQQGRTPADIWVMIARFLKRPELLLCQCKDCPVGQEREKLNLKKEKTCSAKQIIRKIVNTILP